MTKVLMVCLGNICRSPLAEGILKSKVYSHKTFVDSAGTGAYHVGKQPDKRSIAVADNHEIDISTLQSKPRKRHIVQARQLAMYFAKRMTKASLASIGSQIGKRDHATVLHACKTVDNLTETDKQFKKYVEDITKKLTF